MSYWCLISSDLLESLHNKETVRGCLVRSPRGVLCLQGRLNPTVHSLWGHILWARVASQWTLLGVKSSFQPAQLWWSPAGSRPCSYKLTTSWSLACQGLVKLLHEGLYLLTVKCIWQLVNCSSEFYSIASVLVLLEHLTHTLGELFNCHTMFMVSQDLNIGHLRWLEVLHVSRCPLTAQ